MSEPKISSISAIIIRDSDNKVFLGQRSWKKKLSPGQWETIGGKLELKETAEGALRREIKEEINATVKSLEFFGNYFFEGKTTAVYIVVLDQNPQPNIQDFASWGWFDEKGILPLDFATNCKERILDYFKSHNNN